MKKNVLIGGLLGGITFFFLGYLIYGVLLDGYMTGNTSPRNSVPMADFKWWALILSCLGWGYLFALILGWTSTDTLYGGMQKGALLGLLISLTKDLNIYSKTTYFSSINPLILDVAATLIMTSVLGAIIGWYRSIGNKEV